MTVALAPSIAALRETPGSHAAAAAAAAADGGTGGSTSERFAGELELEAGGAAIGRFDRLTKPHKASPTKWPPIKRGPDVEFLEEPVAAVSALETTFRRAPRAQQEAEERHLDALQYLAEATGVTGGLPAPEETGGADKLRVLCCVCTDGTIKGHRNAIVSFSHGVVSDEVSNSETKLREDLFEAQRSALARLVACSAVSLARRLVAHEERLGERRVVTLFAQRLENAVQQALNAPSEELLASARSAVPCESLEEAAENYKTSCRPPTVSFLERLLPLLGGIIEQAVDPLRGGPFFEILERLLVAQNALAPGEIPTLQLGLSCEESLAQSRDLEAADIPGVEQQDQLRLGRAAIYSNFLPEIDCARIMDEEVEELRRQILPGHYRYILPSSLAIGAFCGALAAFSYVETAVIVHTLDERILCHQDYKHLMVMRYLCKAMTESYVDRFAEWVATSPACYKGIFLACALADGKGAFSQMRRRFLRLKELSLEPLGPPLSPHKVICASGFLRTLADLCQPWAVDADRPWTSGQAVGGVRWPVNGGESRVFFLRFDADCLSQLGLQLDDTLARDLKRTAVARFLMSLTNPISFQQRAIGMLLEELGDLVDRASERADQVGKLLARQLVEAKARSRSFTASLVGYSAGGIVVESCLKELQEMVKDGQRAAADVVCDAVMLGTPVSALDEAASAAGDWTALRQLVSGRFVNGFFAQDTVLLSHQFRRGGGALAGCSPLRAPDVENLPLDPFITTHSEYPEQMPLILHRIFRGLWRPKSFLGTALGDESMKAGAVICEGEKGQFRANADQIGWRGASGATRVNAASSVRRAEWFEGSLRLLCEESGQAEVLALEGFKDADFDALWKYLEQTCGVYLKKVKPKAALEEADFDAAMRSIEQAADRVDETAPGSVQKKAKEADLMKKVESVRDGLDTAVSGDKQALSRVFAANGCERVGRLRLVVDTVQLEVYDTDPRWKHLLSKCNTIEAVLKELGTFRNWKPSAECQHSESLLRRAMVRELRYRHGEEPEAQVEPNAVAQDEDAQGWGEASYATYAEEEVYPVQHPQPLPEPEPTAGYGYSEPAAAPAPAAPQVKVPVIDEGQRKRYEDEEVSDPNSVRAGAPDDEVDEATRRMRYTYPNSILEGWVWKRSRILKRWRRRWLVLLPGELMTFKYRGHREPTEVVPAGTVMRIYSADGEVQQARCFCVVVRERNYYMVCDDETQKRGWMQQIEKSLCQRR
ncbi:unnamed protein product [Effrenium voratum]|nr:unnamed protein product [Effrenium voratum]